MTTAISLGHAPKAQPVEVHPDGRLRRVRACFADRFDFTSPDAPALHFTGGLADPALAGLTQKAARISVAGAGLTADAAEIRCLGEAAERLSVRRYDREPVRTVAPDDLPGDLRLHVPPNETAVAALPGIRLEDDTAVWVPASLCLHDDDLAAPPIGRGFAAGETLDDAINRALMEAVERDAAALWWLGGRPAAPLSLEASGVASETLAALRQGCTARRTWLLDLSCDLPGAVAAAVSVPAAGDEGFACGLAAATDLADAAAAAVIEMAQMELSLHLIRGKAKALGFQGLSPADHRQIERSMTVTPAGCPLILPAREPRPQIAASIPVARMDIARMTAPDSALYAVDLTRPELGVPVAAVLAPGLQPLLSGCETPRMAAIRAQTGGGERHHGGVSLL